MLLHVSTGLRPTLIFFPKLFLASPLSLLSSPFCTIIDCKVIRAEIEPLYILWSDVHTASQKGRREWKQRKMPMFFGGIKNYPFSPCPPPLCFLQQTHTSVLCHHWKGINIFLGWIFRDLHLRGRHLPVCSSLKWTSFPLMVKPGPGCHPPDTAKGVWPWHNV